MSSKKEMEEAIHATIRILKKPIVYKMEEDVIRKQNDLMATAIERLQKAL